MKKLLILGSVLLLALAITNCRNSSFNANDPAFLEEERLHAEPAGEVEPEGEVEPRGEVEPAGEVEPRGEVEPEGEVEPKGEVEPDGEVEGQ